MHLLGHRLGRLPDGAQDHAGCGCAGCGRVAGLMVVSGGQGGGMGSLTAAWESPGTGVAEAEVRFSVYVRSGRDLA